MRPVSLLVSSVVLTSAAQLFSGVVLGGAVDKTEADQPSAPLPFSQLRLRLWIKPASCPVGVPVAVYAEVSNPHALPVVWHGRFQWRGRGGQIRPRHGLAFPQLVLSFLNRPVDRHKEYTGGIIITEGEIPRKPRLLPPGATRRTKLLLVPGTTEERSMIVPGGVLLMYTELLDWNRLSGGAVSDARKAPVSILSNTVALTLVAPEGRDAEALDRLKKDRLVEDLGYWPYRRDDVAKERIEAILRFVADYPQSVYAPYARFALGQAHYYGKRYGEAAEVFRQLADEHPHTSVAEDALFLLGECYRQSAQPALAAWAYREVLRRYPDTPAAVDALETLTDVRAYPEMLFAEDRRLDREVSFPADQVLPLEKMLERASELAGVPLEVVRECRRPWRFPEAQRRPLRSFMADWALREKALWVPISSGGYRLEPDPDEKAGSRDDH